MITILMIQSVRFTSVANSYMKEKIEGNYFCDGTRTHNHLFRKQTLNHFAKLAKWLSCVVSTYLCDEFDCICLRCHSSIIWPVWLASLAKWMSVHLRTKWLWVRIQPPPQRIFWLRSWVRVPLQSFKLPILRLFRARSPLTFRKLNNVDSL